MTRQPLTIVDEAGAAWGSSGNDATPEQFDQLYTALPTPTAQLMAEVLIESGLRWAELIELRPADLHAATRMLTVSRTAVELVARFHPTGGRFLDDTVATESAG